MKRAYLTHSSQLLRAVIPAVLLGWLKWSNISISAARSSFFQVFGYVAVDSAAFGHFRQLSGLVWSGKDQSARAQQMLLCVSARMICRGGNREDGLLDTHRKRQKETERRDFCLSLLSFLLLFASFVLLVKNASFDEEKCLKCEPL